MNKFIRPFAFGLLVFMFSMAFCKLTIGCYFTIMFELTFTVASFYNISSYMPDRKLSTSNSPEEGAWQDKNNLQSVDVYLMKAQIDKLKHRVAELEEQQNKIDNKNPLISTNSKTFMATKQLSYAAKRRILITGGAGFVGSHLLDRLMSDGHEVTVADNFHTGSRRNIEHWLGHPNFELLHHDIVNPLFVEVDEIYHLASPASPPHYMMNPVKTLKTNSLGTINMLGLAKRVGARILVASTSEVYGDPEKHPQPESYWGNVNPIGPRSCYDEGKRVAEALAYAYARHEKVDVRVARIFNTYGPRMHIHDGRVVSNFISQALQYKPLTIYGRGSQTRSFQYVDDLVEGLIRLMNSNYTQPVNLGNPDEYQIKSFATIVASLVNDNKSQSVLEYFPSKQDDPQRRRPDISLANRILNWYPNVTLAQGLAKTVEYFRLEVKHSLGQQ